jgi:hypothetical protein
MALTGNGEGLRESSLVKRVANVGVLRSLGRDGILAVKRKRYLAGPPEESGALPNRGADGLYVTGGFQEEVKQENLPNSSPSHE